MSTFTVTFDTDNAAFEEGMMGAEVARILTAVAVTVQQAGGPSPVWEMTLRDYNGNTVGTATWEA